MIAPSKFVQEMETYWTNDLHNEVNPKLKMFWDSLGRTFNAALTDQSDHWRIIAAGTGLGKSVGACSLRC